MVLSVADVTALTIGILAFLAVRRLWPARRPILGVYLLYLAYELGIPQGIIGFLTGLLG